MLALSVYSLLLLALRAVASPLTWHPILPSILLVAKRQLTRWCDAPDTRNAEAMRKLWQDGGVAARLSTYIEDRGEDDWLINMAEYTIGDNGDTMAAGCSQIGQDCLKALDCQALLDDGNGDEYWILRAVQNMANSYEIARDNLVFETLKSSLRISSIVADFSLPADPAPEVAILAYIAGAFTIAAGGFAFNNPATRMVAGIAGGAATIASLASRTTPNIIDATDLDSTLFTAAVALEKALQTLLATAVGGGGDYASLPNQSGDYSSPVPAIFNDGQYLVQGSPESVFSEGYTWLTRALVSRGLDGAGYAVIGETDVTENWCTSDGYAETYGARWFPDIDGGRCMKLYMPETRDGYGAARWRVPDDAIFDKLEKDYGIDLVAFYQASYDCATKGTGDPSPEDLPSDGSLPLCFYRIAAFEGFQVYEDADVPSYLDVQEWPRA